MTAGASAPPADNRSMSSRPFRWGMRIEQDEVGRVLRLAPRRHPARVGDAFEALVARVFEQGEQQLDVGGVVVDDQDVGVGLHGDAMGHRGSCVRGSARARDEGSERRRVWSRSR